MSFLNRLFDAFSQVPAYCRHIMVGNFMIPALIFIIWFLVVIFFTSAVVNVLRRIFVAAAVISGVIGYFRNDYELIWINIIALIVLLITRLLRHIFVTVRQDRANAQIEAKALAKARKRRGSWENKQAYSGESKPLTFDIDLPSDTDTADIPESSGSDSTKDTGASDVSNVIALKKKSAKAGKPAASKKDNPSMQKTAPIPVIPEDEDDESYGNREQILETIRQLKDLKDKGVLTEEEYNRKTKELYSRMG